MCSLRPGVLCSGGVGGRVHVCGGGAVSDWGVLYSTVVFIFYCVDEGISMIVEKEKGRGCQNAKTRHKIAKAPLREG